MTLINFLILLPLFFLFFLQGEKVVKTWENFSVIFRVIKMEFLQGYASSDEEKNPENNQQPIKKIAINSAPPVLDIVTVSSLIKITNYTTNLTNFSIISERSTLRKCKYQRSLL